MKFIHISTVGVYNTTRFSAVPTNDSYFTGADPEAIIEGSPTVLYDDLVFCKEVKLIYTHGTLYDASETNLTDYYTMGQVDSTFATKNELSTKQGKITGNYGEVVYHDGLEVFTQTVMNEGYVVNTTSDLNKCKNDSPSSGIILNTWRRFSILDGISNARQSEMEAWTVDGNTLTQPKDSESFVGLLSPKSYSNYEVIVKCFSTGADDDTIGIVAAHAVGADGKEHTLSFLRTPGGSSTQSKPRWSAVLDFNGSFEGVAYNQAIVSDNSSSTGFPSAVTNWNNATIENGTTIKVKRTGNIFTATCSQFGSNVIDGTTIITVDLNAASLQFPLLSLFKGSAPWGYCCFSQPNTKFTTILVTDPDHYIYDFTTNTVLEFNTSSQAWTTVENKNPLTEMGVGRFSYNKTTGKLFYNNGVEAVEVASVINSDSGLVTGVEVNGTSVVNDGVAEITIPAQVQANWEETNSSSKAFIQNKPTIPAAQVQANWNEIDSSSKAFIQNKPTIPAEQVQANWNETDIASKAYIVNKPTIPAEQVQSDWNETNISSKAYIQNKPAIPAEQVQANWTEANTTSKAYIQNKPTIPPAQVQSDWNESNTSSKAYIQNKPTIPEQVQADWEETNATSKAFIQNKPTIPEQVQANWSETDTTSKSYIQNKPVIPAAQVQANWSESDTTSKAYILNKPTIPEQIQANWNETNSTSKAFIQNKPTIPAETTVTQVLTSGTEIARVNGTSIYTTPITAGLKQISNLDSYKSSASVGEIVQYTGVSTSNYTHGYIYQLETLTTVPAGTAYIDIPSNGLGFTPGRYYLMNGSDYQYPTEQGYYYDVPQSYVTYEGVPIDFGEGSYFNDQYAYYYFTDIFGNSVTCYYNNPPYTNKNNNFYLDSMNSEISGGGSDSDGSIVYKTVIGKIAQNTVSDYTPTRWVRIDVQPQATIPIHFVSASSISHDMSNINRSGYNINDLVVVTDLSSTLYYSFYYNGSLITNNISGVPYADVMFRYTGSGFKPISSPAIIV